MNDFIAVGDITISGIKYHINHQLVVSVNSLY